MSEKPILFSSEMVKSILQGRKTQTRRLTSLEDVNSKPYAWTFRKMAVLDWMTKSKYKGRFGAYFESEAIEPRTLSICPVTFPYGNVGERLWVRETWAHDDPDCKDIKCGNRDHIWWKANENKIVADSFAGSARWRPSIFMPRWASRITLEVTNVRVERLQDITSADVLAEGIKKTEVDDYWLAPLAGVPDYPWGHAQQAYAALWNSINSKRGYGWDVNPWVWVVEFKKVNDELSKS